VSRTLFSKCSPPNIYLVRSRSIGMRHPESSRSVYFLTKRVARNLIGLLEMMQQLVNGMNVSKRPFIPIDVLTRNAEIADR
jgi:hypothetical protein